jgi:hypothetical protein
VRDAASLRFAVLVPRGLVLLRAATVNGNAYLLTWRDMPPRPNARDDRYRLLRICVDESRHRHAEMARDLEGAVSTSNRVYHCYFLLRRVTTR